VTGAVWFERWSRRSSLLPFVGQARKGGEAVVVGRPEGQAHVLERTRQRELGRAPTFKLMTGPARWRTTVEALGFGAAVGGRRRR
jgi:hypothetical protein